MGAHMKTIIEVADVLFESAKELARRSKTTMQALIEDGLRQVVNEQLRNAAPAFKLKNESVRGKAILIEDPRRWQEEEEAHVGRRAVKPNFKRVA